MSRSITEDLGVVLEALRDGLSLRGGSRPHYETAEARLAEIMVALREGVCARVVNVAPASINVSGAGITAEEMDQIMERHRSGMLHVAPSGPAALVPIAELDALTERIRLLEEAVVALGGEGRDG
jgi:hypothetical protein